MAFIDGTCKGDAVARVIIDNHSLELLRLQMTYGEQGKDKE